MGKRTEQGKKEEREKPAQKGKRELVTRKTQSTVSF